MPKPGMPQGKQEDNSTQGERANPSTAASAPVACRIPPPIEHRVVSEQNLFSGRSSGRNLLPTQHTGPPQPPSSPLGCWRGNEPPTKLLPCAPALQALVPGHRGSSAGGSSSLTGAQSGRHPYQQLQLLTAQPIQAPWPGRRVAHELDGILNSMEF